MVTAPALAPPAAIPPGQKALQQATLGVLIEHDVEVEGKW